MFDYELPASLGCAELYLDREHFMQVESVAEMRAGDLAWFGLRDALKRPEEIRLRYDEDDNLMNWREFPVKHVAIATSLGVEGDPLLLHATYVEGRENKIWPLSKFSTYRNYRKLYGITRLVAAHTGFSRQQSEFDSNESVQMLVPST